MSVQGTERPLLDALQECEDALLEQPRREAMGSRIPCHAAERGLEVMGGAMSVESDTRVHLGRQSGFAPRLPLASWVLVLSLIHISEPTRPY